jgi:hypothetical protein
LNKQAENRRENKRISGMSKMQKLKRSSAFLKRHSFSAGICKNDGV